MPPAAMPSVTVRARVGQVPLCQVGEIVSLVARITVELEGAKQSLVGHRTKVQLVADRGSKALHLSEML